MKRLLLGALVAALCSAPGFARAEAASVTAPPARHAQVAPATEGEPQGPGGEEGEYAEREQAAPQLGEFSGGADGIYIGAGALVAVLLVVLLIAVL